MAEDPPAICEMMHPVAERDMAGEAGLDAMLRNARAPFIIRGLVSHWPLVQAGLRSARDARQYLLDHARQRPFTVSVGPPGHDGRMFYDADMAMNFRTGRGSLPEILSGIDANEGRQDAPSVYLSSIDVHEYFDGLHDANHVDLGNRNCLASIWIGTRTRIAAHNDFPDNLACCAAGYRRFILFPPDQFANLYPGPIDNTPAGRAVSMVDFHDPDFVRHPRFHEALKHAQLADLSPGDALFIPSMWWHHVEGLDPFNILVNYWWRDTPAWLGQPQDALNHAILAIRDLPEGDRQVWRDLFDHYVFGGGDDAAAHIPENARGVLDRLTPESAGRLRAFLLRTLSR